MKYFAVLIVTILFLPNALIAETGEWGPDCEVFFNVDGDATLFVLPDGGGDSFTEARDSFGNFVDATVSLRITSINTGNPIVGFPAEDMWLESLDGGLAPCDGGTCADHDTDSNGMTTWVNPLHAGGSSNAGCQVYCNGAPVYGYPLSLHFNSADMNGDGIVCAIDISPFAAAFFGEYDFAADFNYDGRIDINDLVLLARAYGGSCP